VKAFLLSSLFTVGILQSAPLELTQIRAYATTLDAHVHQRLKTLEITPTAKSSPEVFLRRAYLQVAGRIPSYGEAKAFLDSSSPHKRTELLEKLISSPAMKGKLFNYWADLLRLNSTRDFHGLGWHVWLRSAVDQDLPYHRLVHEMLSAKGHAAENPAVGYYLRDRGMLLDNISNTAQVFHGLQIGCAQCHDHPFDDFSQREYYQLASFLGQTDYRFGAARTKVRETLAMGGGRRDLSRERPPRRKRGMMRRGKKGLRTVFRYHHRNAISENLNRFLKLPADYQYANGSPGEKIAPASFYGPKLENVSLEKRREAFANWATSPEHPYFTKVITNRLWHYVFGYGVMPTLDDWSNAPDKVNSELITVLEETMKAVNYDTRQFLRILYHTDLFQREVVAEKPAEGFVFNFAGPVLRRMKAAELRDSFVTFENGSTDELRNNNLSKVWHDYTKAFRFLMGANPREMRQIKRISDDTESSRKMMRRQTSKMRQEVRLARENGDFQKAKSISQKIRQTRKKNRESQTDLGDGSLASMAALLSRRRPPFKRPNEPRKSLLTSELPGPAKGGGLLREFGASDRRTPEAGHSHASVPQALRLLNGAETRLLTRRKNKFVIGLKKAGSAEERLNFIFLSLYSAYPTEAEKTAYLPETQSEESSRVLARAMLTSNRFLFIQ